MSSKDKSNEEQPPGGSAAGEHAAAHRAAESGERSQKAEANPPTSELKIYEPEDLGPVPLIDHFNPERGLIEPVDDGSGNDDHITKVLKRQGVKINRWGMTPGVFWPALAVVVLVTVSAIAFPDTTSNALTALNNAIVSVGGSYYVLVVACLVGFALFFGLSKYGTIRLGADDERPEFGLLSWFAMLFAAGMGIGLVFFGVAEPLTFATSDPKPSWANSHWQPGQLALAQTFLHWGLHPWSIYAVIGLAIAYGIHRRGRPVSIRWALEPLLGKVVKGWVGDAVDTIAVLGTVFGVATSLGLGVQQIAAGVASLGVVGEVNNTLLVILIVIISFLAMLSVISGLGAGIKWLSNINLSLAGIFLITMILMGPTLFIFRTMIQSMGLYLADFFNMTFDTAAYTGEEGQTWMSSWSIFYWGWWMSWAPFVGVFIARISRGRTIREFILGVLLVPTAVTFVWFSAMGGTALYEQFFTDSPVVAAGEDVVAERVLFQVLESLPLGHFLSVIAIILVTIFFITSSDSGSLVVTMLTSGGHPNPPVWSRVVWALMSGAIAIALLLVGGLGGLQAGAIATALPFSVILLLMCFSTMRALSVDFNKSAERRLAMRVESIQEHVAENVAEALSETLDEQLGAALKSEFDDRFEQRLDDRIDYRIERTRGVFPGLNRLRVPRLNEIRRRGDAPRKDQSTTAEAPGSTSGAETERAED